MMYYIIFALQLLFAGAIIWRMRQRSGQPAGCLAGGYIILVVVVLTSLMLGLGYFITNEMFDMILEDSQGSLSTAPLENWIMGGGLCILMLLMVAGTCSAVGFAFTGSHPKFCKTIWKALASIIFLPLVVLFIASISFGCAFVICMRLISPEFDDMGWGWLILLLIFCVVTLLASAGMISFILELNGNKLKEYNPEDKDRIYRRKEMKR